MLQWAGLVIAVVGIPAAWVFSRRSRRRPTLAFGMQHDIIFTPEASLRQDGLELRHSGGEIDGIRRTRVALWNAGGDAIRRADVVASDPIRLAFEPDDSPLQVRCLTRSREQIDLELVADEHGVQIEFDFLDDGDGAILEVLHQKERPTLVGSLIGAGLDDRGTLDLTDERIELARSATRREKFKAKFPERHLRSGSILLATYVVIGAALFGWDRWKHRNPSIVNLDDFETETISGQRKLADAIRNSGETQLKGVVLVLILSGIALMIVALFMRAFEGRGFRGRIASTPAER